LKIVESKQFKDELKAIAYYIRRDNLSASVEFVQTLKKKIKHLADSPYQYRKSVYFHHDNIRDMIYKGYTIVYEIDSEEKRLELLSIFNQNLPDL